MLRHKRSGLLLNKERPPGKRWPLLFCDMTMVSENKLVVAEGDIRRQVVDMLKQNDLPTSDIDADKILFALIKNGSIVGTGGVEYFDTCALLRSVSVTSRERGKGLGKF